MSDSTLARLAALDTNTVSDALDFLGLPGATFGLRPLWQCPKIVGRASTVQVGPKTYIPHLAARISGEFRP